MKGSGHFVLSGKKSWLCIGAEKARSSWQLGQSGKGMTYAQSEPFSLLCFTLVGAESLNLMEGSLVEIKLNVLRVIVRVIHTNGGYSFM